jgi:hypothetical protein
VVEKKNLQQFTFFNILITFLPGRNHQKNGVKLRFIAELREFDGIVQCVLLFIILVQYFAFANSKLVLLFTKLDIILSTLFLGAFCYFKMVRFLTNNCVSNLCVHILD